MNLESGLYMLFGLSIHFTELSQAQNLEPSSSHACNASTARPDLTIQPSGGKKAQKKCSL